MTERKSKRKSKWPGIALWLLYILLAVIMAVLLVQV